MELLHFLMTKLSKGMMRFIRKKLFHPQTHNIHHTPRFFFFLWLENVETPNYYEWKLFTFRKNRRAIMCTCSEASFSYWVLYVDFVIVLGGFLWVLIQTKITINLFFFFFFFHLNSITQIKSLSSFSQPPPSIVFFQ